MSREQKIHSVEGHEKGDRVLASDAFGRTYIGTVEGFTKQVIAGRDVFFVRVKDSSGNVISRNIKNCKSLAARR